MIAVQDIHGWTLDRLLDGLTDAPNVAISDITLDSRAVTQGAVFIAVAGLHTHGIAFAPQALQRGAVAVVTDLEVGDERLRSVAARVPVISLPATHDIASTLAVRFFGHPSAALDTIAVTGTNGKTSIGWLLANALRIAGQPAALSGTLGYGRPDALMQQSLTTPDAVTLQRQARDFCNDGCQAMVFEASSHALHQGRLADLDVDIAVFSNLTRDHLDYHEDMDAYFAAKATLFEGERHARIIGCDDAYGLRLWERYAATAWRVSVHAGHADAQRFVVVKSVRKSADGLQVSCNTHQGEAHIQSALVGDFNVQNLALALAALMAAGVSVSAAADALSRVVAPPGRMQRVGGAGPQVFVDFAHTPSALTAALAALREHCHGELWCVFGCGGDRDRGKRPLMAKAALAADHVIVTSDNPRYEAPRAIIEDVIAATRDRVAVEVDRAAAIRSAIASAAAHDVVLIAGKGHEKVQHVAGEALPFDDVEAAMQALAARDGAAC